MLVVATHLNSMLVGSGVMHGVVVIFRVMNPMSVIPRGVGGEVMGMVLHGVRSIVAILVMDATRPA